MNLSQSATNLLKNIIPKKMLRRARYFKRLIAYDTYPKIPFDNTYPWLNYAFLEVVADGRCAYRPAYVWGILQAAALAKVLGIPKISVIEFGVAGGFGLLCAEAIARSVEVMTEIEIDLYGFDTGVGLPKPQDVRDQPNMWFEGQLPMDREALEAALVKAQLVMGPVNETLPSFVANNPAPIGFVSVDVDLYTSTSDALNVLRTDHKNTLPRVVCYFDDIFGHTYNEFCGERLAINEFNASDADRKICPIYKLRNFLPQTEFLELWPDGMYWAHLFKHPMYNRLDSFNKAVISDIEGVDIRVPPNSGWR